MEHTLSYQVKCLGYTQFLQHHLLNLPTLQTKDLPQQQGRCLNSGREESPSQPSHLGAFWLKGPNSTFTGTTLGLAGSPCLDMRDPSASFKKRRRVKRSRFR